MNNVNNVVEAGERRSTKDTKQFVELKLDGLHLDQVTNPILRTLLMEQSGLLLDKNTPIKPEDEWLIFPD